jgi:hypothetical protein
MSALANPLVAVYYQQLTEGCGHWDDCGQEHCQVGAYQGDARKTAALAKAIVMAAHGPANLCFYQHLNAFVEMAETAAMVHAAGEEDAFEELCGQVKPFFSHPAHFVKQAAALAPPHLKPGHLALVFRTICAADASVAQCLFTSLKTLVHAISTAPLPPQPGGGGGGSSGGGGGVGGGAAAMGQKEKAVVLAVISFAFDALIAPDNYDLLVSVVIDMLTALPEEQKAYVARVWATVRCLLWMLRRWFVGPWSCLSYGPGRRLCCGTVVRTYVPRSFTHVCLHASFVLACARVCACACVCLCVCVRVCLCVYVCVQAPSEQKRHLAQVFQQYISLRYYTVDLDNNNVDELYRRMLAPVQCLDLLYRATFGVRRRAPRTHARTLRGQQTTAL